MRQQRRTTAANTPTTQPAILDPSIVLDLAAVSWVADMEEVAMLALEEVEVVEEIEAMYDVEAEVIELGTLDMADGTGWYAM